jgi:hypothetical protein
MYNIPLRLTVVNQPDGEYYGLVLWGDNGVEHEWGSRDPEQDYLNAMEWLWYHPSEAQLIQFDEGFSIETFNKAWETWYRRVGVIDLPAS